MRRPSLTLPQTEAFPAHLLVALVDAAHAGGPVLLHALLHLLVHGPQLCLQPARAAAHTVRQCDRPPWPQERVRAQRVRQAARGAKQGGRGAAQGLCAVLSVDARGVVSLSAGQQVVAFRGPTMPSPPLPPPLSTRSLDNLLLLLLGALRPVLQRLQVPLEVLLLKRQVGAAARLLLALHQRLDLGAVPTVAARTQTRTGRAQRERRSAVPGVRARTNAGAGRHRQHLGAAPTVAAQQPGHNGVQGGRADAARSPQDRLSPGASGGACVHPLAGAPAPQRCASRCEANTHTHTLGPHLTASWILRLTSPTCALPMGRSWMRPACRAKRSISASSKGWFDAFCARARARAVCVRVLQVAGVVARWWAHAEQRGKVRLCGSAWAREREGEGDAHAGPRCSHSQGCG